MVIFIIAIIILAILVVKAKKIEKMESLTQDEKDELILANFKKYYGRHVQGLPDMPGDKWISFTINPNCVAIRDSNRPDNVTYNREIPYENILVTEFASERVVMNQKANSTIFLDGANAFRDELVTLNYFKFVFKDENEKEISTLLEVYCTEDAIRLINKRKKELGIES